MTVKRRLTFKILLFLIFTDLLETFAQFCFKKGATARIFWNQQLARCAFIVKQSFLPRFYGLGFLAVLVIFITWVTILSKVDLTSWFLSRVSATSPFPLFHSVFLHEYISRLRWIGIFCILIGVILVSASSRHKERAA